MEWWWYPVIKSKGFFDRQNFKFVTIILASAVFLFGHLLFGATVVIAQSLGTDAYRAETDTRIMELENRLRKITGQYEEAVYRLTHMSRKLEQSLGDIEFRLQRLEGSAPLSAVPGGSEQTATGADISITSASTVAATASTVQAAAPGGPAGITAIAAATPEHTPESNPLEYLEGDTPEAQFRFAFAKLRRDNFVAAENAFRAFLTLHPDHPYTPNAKYWLGKSYYARGDYENAARVLNEGYGKYAETDKGPDMLLHLGLSLHQLGQTAEACVAFAEILSQHPEASDSVKRQAVAGRKSGNCG